MENNVKIDSKGTRLIYNVKVYPPRNISTTENVSEESCQRVNKTFIKVQWTIIQNLRHVAFKFSDTPSLLPYLAYSILGVPFTVFFELV